jgi:hypothetical protein
VAHVLKGRRATDHTQKDEYDSFVQCYRTMPRIKEFDISGKISNASEIEGVSYSFKSKGRVLDEGTVRPDGSFEISFESRKKR